ncbi:CheY-like chemotaxis protein [Bradyrhizobium sp. LB7.1]
MKDETVELAGRRPKTFGRRKVTPRACVADGKRHLRAFLSEVLEDLGFVTTECASADELRTVLASELPDLILLGIAADGIEPGMFLETLVREAFDGKVLAVGARESIIVRGRAAGRRGIRPCDAAAADDALCRGDVARARRDAAAERAGAEPGRACRRGPACRLARALVPAQDRRAHADPQRRRGAGADAASDLGRGAAGLFHPRRARPASARPVRIRDRARHAGLALSAGAAEPGRSLDQFARVVSDGAAGRARSLPPHADASGVRRADDRDRQRRGRSATSITSPRSPAKCACTISACRSTISAPTGRR